VEPINSIDEAKRAIASFEGAPEDFALPISDGMQDQLGVNMAIITDYILARDWEPDGFEQRQGFRVYRYKAFEYGESE
jgi:hypothetical protein